jgi:LmbE family N-acetylglucosaminyl deacetylase
VTEETEPSPVPETPPEAVEAGGPAEPGPASAHTGPVLAVFGHPDDAEIGVGGTLCKWAAAGRDVHLLILTNGDRGSENRDEDRVQLAVTRKRESEDAGRVAGLKSVVIRDDHDGELENSYPVRMDIARRIRQVRPTILVTCDPTAWFFGNQYFNHSDHRKAGAAALDAAFPGAGNALFFEGLLRHESLEPWNVPEIWIGWSNEPNHYEDITGFMERKLEALRAHRSQVIDNNSIGFFEQWLPLEAVENGRKIGTEHAEAFRVLQLS